MVDAGWRRREQMRSGRRHPRRAGLNRPWERLTRVSVHGRCGRWAADKVASWSVGGFCSPGGSRASCGVRSNDRTRLVTAGAAELVESRQPDRSTGAVRGCRHTHEGETQSSAMSEISPAHVRAKAGGPSGTTISDTIRPHNQVHWRNWVASVSPVAVPGLGSAVELPPGPYHSPDDPRHRVWHVYLLRSVVGALWHLDVVLLPRDHVSCFWLRSISELALIARHLTPEEIDALFHSHAAHEEVAMEGL